MLFAKMEVIKIFLNLIPNIFTSGALVIKPSV